MKQQGIVGVSGQTLAKFDEAFRAAFDKLVKEGKTIVTITSASFVLGNLRADAYGYILWEKE